MSWQATSWAAKQVTGSMGRKVILILIANSCDASGVTYSGQEKIAAAAECTRQTVSANLAELEKMKLISRHRRTRGNGSRTSDYIVLAPRAEDRGDMLDAESEEVSESVRVDATTGLSPDSLRKENHDSMSAKQGDQRTVSEKGTAVDERARTRSGRKVLRVNGKPVDGVIWRRSVAALGVFNTETDKGLSAFTGAGDPSENGKRIYLRLLAWPDVKDEKIAETIRNTLASKWWGDDAPSVGVIFGPKIFEENLEREAPKPKKKGRFTRDD